MIVVEMKFPGIKPQWINEVHVFLAGDHICSTIFESCSVKTDRGVQPAPINPSLQRVLFAQMTSSTLNTQFGTYAVTIRIIRTMTIVDWKLTTYGQKCRPDLQQADAPKELEIGCPLEVITKIWAILGSLQDNEIKIID